MITIGIIFWEGDYEYYDFMLKRLKECVHIPYELITIDNTEGGKLKDKATFSFGYNAYQFAARYRALELAKGDYVWFIDGDDDIFEVNDFSYTEDVIVFGAQTVNGSITYKDAVITENIFTFDTVKSLEPVLWNKIIKRSLFDLKVLEPYKDMKIVPNEDTIWSYSALKNAKSLRTVSKIIYKHKQGFSNKMSDVLISDIEHIVYGYKESSAILRKLITDDEFYHNVIMSTNIWLLAMAFRSEDILKALDILDNYITKDEIKEIFTQITIAIPPKSDEDKERIKETIKKKYGEDFFTRTVTSHNWFDDGHEEDVTITEEWW